MIVLKYNQYNSFLTIPILILKLFWEGNQFYCDKCSYKSKLKADLKLHIMKHHDGVKYEMIGYMNE